MALSCTNHVQIPILSQQLSDYTRKTIHPIMRRRLHRSIRLMFDLSTYDNLQKETQVVRIRC